MPALSCPPPASFSMFSLAKARQKRDMTSYERSAPVIPAWPCPWVQKLAVYQPTLVSL